MSRVRRAGIAAAFGYLQFALAMASGILLVPFILSRVGTEAYGVWLGVGELVAYAALADLGVVGVLPWLIAERDGRADRQGIRDLLAAGVVVALAAAALFVVVAAGLVSLAPRVVSLSPEVRGVLAGPVALTIAGVALAYPLRVFHALVAGLQDVTFAGSLTVLQLALNVVLVVVLLLNGYGLYALAAGAVVPTLGNGLVSLLRTARLAPDLLRGWRVPSRTTLRYLAVQGFGAWTAAFGWRMVAATNTLVILSFAGPVAATVFAFTARLGEIAMQMSWQLPDAGLVGLAQLLGEGPRGRIRAAALQLSRMGMLGGGAVACAVLTFNAVFVGLWVGPDRFGGFALNAALAAAVLAHTLSHVLMAVSSTLGGRVQAGAATVVQGAVHLGGALLLGHWLGLAGVAVAAVVSMLLVSLPVGLHLMRRHAGVSPGALWREVLGPWSARCGPLLLLGAGLGPALAARPAWVAVAALPPLALVFLWMMRPLVAALPLPGRLRGALAQLRLVEAAR